MLRTHTVFIGCNLPVMAPNAHRNPSVLWRGVSSESLCTQDYQEAGTLWRKQTEGETETEGKTLKLITAVNALNSKLLCNVCCQVKKLQFTFLWFHCNIILLLSYLVSFSFFIFKYILKLYLIRLGRVLVVSNAMSLNSCFCNSLCVHFSIANPKLYSSRFCQWHLVVCGQVLQTANWLSC